MAGVRVFSNEHVTGLLDEALRMTVEIDPPDDLRETVFSAMVNAAQLPDMQYSNSEAIEAALDALAIIEQLNPPTELRVKAFHFALTGTSQREQHILLKDISGGKGKPQLQ